MRAASTGLASFRATELEIQAAPLWANRGILHLIAGSSLGSVRVSDLPLHSS